MCRFSEVASPRGSCRGLNYAAAGLARSGRHETWEPHRPDQTACRFSEAASLRDLWGLLKWQRPAELETALFGVSVRQGLLASSTGAGRAGERLVHEKRARSVLSVAEIGLKAKSFYGYLQELPASRAASTRTCQHFCETRLPFLLPTLYES